MLPKYVSQCRDRHGVLRFRFRRRGASFYFASAPGSDQFAGEYARYLAGKRPVQRAKSQSAALTRQVKDYLGRRGFPSKAPYIYYLDDGRGAVKIGRSDNILVRMRNYVTGSPNHLRLLCIHPGTADDEKRIHAELSDHRLRGEWFRLSREVRQFIRARQRILSNPHRSVLSNLSENGGKQPISERAGRSGGTAQSQSFQRENCPTYPLATASPQRATRPNCPTFLTPPNTQSGHPMTLPDDVVEAVRNSSDWLNDLRDHEIQHMARAALEAARYGEMRECLRDCADDLAAELTDRYYQAGEMHPALKSKYDRDMAPVVKARALLSTIGEPDNGV